MKKLLTVLIMVGAFANALDVVKNKPFSLSFTPDNLAMIKFGGVLVVGSWGLTQILNMQHITAYRNEVNEATRKRLADDLVVAVNTYPHLETSLRQAHQLSVNAVNRTAKRNDLFLRFTSGAAVLGSIAYLGTWFTFK